MKRIFWIFLFSLLLGAAWFTSVSAQTPIPPSDDEVNAIAKQMFCPVCENIPLDVCSTEACKQWRELIRLKLSEGWTEQQIKDYFVEQYGQRVLADPNWLLYTIPPALMLVGVYLLYRAFRSMRQTIPDESEPAQAPPDKTDDYLRRVEEELKNRN